MANSLQDQFLKAGLISGQQAKKAKSEKRKQAKLQQKNKVSVVNENKIAAQKAQTEKTARDRLLNQQQQQQAESKAVDAQIRDLIESNCQPQDDPGEAYHFNDSGIVKTIYVSESKREQIIQGRLAIVKLGNQYHLITMEIAEKIRQRDDKYIINLNPGKQSSLAEDNPYADYQIPDDLIW